MKYLDRCLEFQKVKLKNGDIGWICDILEPGVAYMLEIWEPEDPDQEYRLETILHSDIECLLVEVEVPVGLVVPMPTVITEKWEEDRKWLKQHSEKERKQQQEEFEKYKQQKRTAVA
ncbi:MAG: hypothetical protein LBN97_08285 [Oscillospiraceae bacterium]|jgi:hypothetical protein|nr:hypothetical protein [Oscillospiraceae bacterium]